MCIVLGVIMMFVCWIFIEEISFSRQKVKNITNVSDHDIHS